MKQKKESKNQTLKNYMNIKQKAKNKNEMPHRLCQKLKNKRQQINSKKPKSALSKFVKI